MRTIKLAVAKDHPPMEAEAVFVRGYKHLCLARALPAPAAPGDSPAKDRARGWGVTHVPTGLAVVPMGWSRRHAEELLRLMATATPWIETAESDPARVCPSEAAGREAEKVRRAACARLADQLWAAKAAAGKKAAATRALRKAAARNNDGRSVTRQSVGG